MNNDNKDVDPDRLSQTVAPESESNSNSESTINGDLSFSPTLGSESEPVAAVSHRLFEAGETLGKYQIKKKLGQGGMAAVYLAFDPMIEREVAIKVLPPHVADQPVALERFLSEARATGRLSHRNVVAIYDIDKDKGFYYIVMELVRGGSVSDYINRRETIDWQRSSVIAAEAADGLAAAHAAGLIHRDIKPENLMLTEDGVVKVVDFGLAKLVDGDEARMNITGEGQFVGTPHYMSPEQFDAENVDERSDVYGMGGTLYALLTDRHPFHDATNLIALMAAHVRKAAPDPRDVNPEIPEALSGVVRQAMAKSPDQRFADAGELATAIREALGDKPTAATIAANRDLHSALLVEPSKMQGMMTSKSISGQGVSDVAVCDSAAESLRMLDQKIPDLLVTSMELPDSQGNELIAGWRDDRRFDRSVLILHSSKPSLEQIASIPDTGPLGVVSKQCRPAIWLRAVHAFSFLNVPNFVEQADLASLRCGVVCESRLSGPVAQLIREAELLDVQVTTFDEQAQVQQFAGVMDLVLVERTAGDVANDSGLYTDLLSRARVDAKVLAAVQVDGDAATLRAVRIGKFSGITRTPLNDGRLARLATVAQDR